MWHCSCISCMLVGRYVNRGAQACDVRVSRDWVSGMPARNESKKHLNPHVCIERPCSRSGGSVNNLQVDNLCVAKIRSHNEKTRFSGVFRN